MNPDLMIDLAHLMFTDATSLDTDYSEAERRRLIKDSHKIITAALKKQDGNHGK